jgi:hypothetical protein
MLFKAEKHDQIRQRLAPLRSLVSEIRADLDRPQFVVDVDYAAFAAAIARM